MGTFEYSDGRVKINNREFSLETFNILFPLFSVGSHVLKIFYEQDKNRLVVTKMATLLFRFRGKMEMNTFPIFLT